MGKNLNTYRDIAENEYRYLLTVKDISLQQGYFNPLVVQCSQICEKYLKAVVETLKKVNTEDFNDLLKTHNLRKIVTVIKSEIPDFGVNYKDAKYVGDFYFDASYPGENYTIVDKETIIECLGITEDIRRECLSILNRKKIEESKNSTWKSNLFG